MGIGDAVEVCFIEREVGEVWRPATVINVQVGAVGVAFADHSWMVVRNGQWRRA